MGTEGHFDESNSLTVMGLKVVGRKLSLGELVDGISALVEEVIEELKELGFFCSAPSFLETFHTP